MKDDFCQLPSNSSVRDIEQRHKVDSNTLSGLLSPLLNTTLSSGLGMAIAFLALKIGYIIKCTKEPQEHCK